MLLEVTIVKLPARTIYGLWRQSGDKTVTKDIPALSKAYNGVTGKPPEQTLPFYVLSRGYDEATGQFSLFAGGEDPHEQLDNVTLPEGAYAKIVVKPKFGFLWGSAIGEAKRYFYTRWLPASPYLGLNMEYEYHTEHSLGKKPQIDLLFAIQQKPS